MPQQQLFMPMPITSQPHQRAYIAFLKSMESFEKTFDEKTSVILSTNSEFYKFLKSME